MGVVGSAALLANGGVAVMLYRFRTGDANMRSVLVCSRNDAIGNLAVVLAAAGVFGTGTGWPDVIVAATMGALGLSGGLGIVRQASITTSPARMRTDVRSLPARRILARTMIVPDLARQEVATGDRARLGGRGTPMVRVVVMHPPGAGACPG